MSSRRIDRVAAWVAAAASVWFAFAAAWGLFASVNKGHNGSGSSGTLLMAEVILRWHTLYPSWALYGLTHPTPADYYTHHPFGVFYLAVPFLAVIGHHDCLVRLPAVLMSAATPPLLYGTMRERWGAVGAAATACGFTVVPLALGYANFHSLEVMTLFGWVLFFFGQTRYLATKQGRYLAASLAGVVFATSADWPGYVAIGALLGWGLFRAFVLPRRLTPPFDQARYARWWALSTGTAIFTFLLWMGLFYHADRIVEWVQSAFSRGAGTPPEHLSVVLASRQPWIEYSFTPLAIRVGKVALPISVLRAAALRRDEEFYGIAVLFGAVVQYLGFPGGADVHIFWPHHFALYFAFALGALVTTLGSVVRFVGNKVRLRGMATAGAVASLAATLLICAAIIPDGWRGLRLFRATGGRYDDRGSPIYSGTDTIWVTERFIRPEMLPGMHVDAHPSVQWWWEDIWAAKALGVEVNAPPRELGPVNVSHPFFIARPSRMSADELLQISKAAHVRVYGNVWLVDERKAAAPIDAYRVDERDPNPIQWVLYGDADPIRSTTATPDPFLTWEWRTHLGVRSKAPTIAPRTLDELRIAHNAAVEEGNAAAAELYQARIEGQIDRNVTARYNDGTRIVGVRVGGGSRGKLEVWFLAGDQPRGDAVFTLHSTVDRAEPLSLVPASPVVREMSWDVPLPPKLWRKGFLYVTETLLLHRTGYERYTGSWVSRDAQAPPRRVDGPAETWLALVR
ncbi:MAG: ArnT family glycosyltransferase [Polyangiaceae bacterium]